MAAITIALPQAIKIENKSKRAISFVPYRENFTSVLAAGKTLEFEVSNSGQVIYYLKQATEGLEVTQIASLGTADDNLTVFKTPAVMTLTNTSSVVKTFQPYKENFTVDVKAGDNYAIEVTTVGQILYYLAQATEGLTVTYAAKVVTPGK